MSDQTLTINGINEHGQPVSETVTVADPAEFKAWAFDRARKRHPGITDNYLEDAWDAAHPLYRMGLENEFLRERTAWP
jgi:hypothetical protein